MKKYVPQIFRKDAITSEEHFRKFWLQTSWFQKRYGVLHINFLYPIRHGLPRVAKVTKSLVARLKN